MNLKAFFLKMTLIPSRIKDKLNKIKSDFDEFPEKTNSLSNFSSTNIYVRQLKKGLKDKNVNTIALLGEFSSGKSSIIHSSLNSKKTLYLFPNEKFYDDGGEKQAFLDSLTKSDISNIGPDSEIYRKYIKNKKLIKLWSLVTFISIFISLLLFNLMVRYSEWFKAYVLIFFDLNIDIYWYCLLPIIIGLLICIFMTLYICNYSLSFKMKGVEVKKGEFDEDDEIFTRIIFHLIRRRIKYIVFEDLDRDYNNLFKFNTFKHLREFCLKINSSPNIKETIKFIYCFNDKIFNNSEERLKSFDLILPIFPIISAKNSYCALLEQDIIKQKNLSKKLLADLSIFISNQRLYNSIIYEFKMMCMQIDCDNYNEMFALCCIKNIYPSLHHELFKDDNFFDLAFRNIDVDYDFNKMVTNIEKICKNNNPNYTNEEAKNAMYLFKICIKNKFLTGNYKSILNSNKYFLDENDADYLRKVAAKDFVNPNIELKNFEHVLTQHFDLINPNCFNISLFVYCFNEKKDEINQMIEALKKCRKDTIESLINSNLITEEIISFIAEKMYGNQIFESTVFSSDKQLYKHYILKKYINTMDFNNIPVLIKNEIIKLYFSDDLFFNKLGYKTQQYIIEKFEGKFEKIPVVEDDATRKNVYDCIVKYKRFIISIDNIASLFDDFSKSPLHIILSNNNLFTYIGVNDVLNLIKDLDRNDDTVEDLLTLIKNPNFKPNSIDSTKYLGQFAYSVKYESQVQTHISFLLKNKLFVFNCDTIINCYSRFILLNKECDDLIEYIKNSIACGQEFANDSKVKFDINLSKKLLNSLNSNEIEIMKSSIELAIFNDYNFIISLDIEHIKVFEYEITLKKDLIIKLLDKNLEFLKQLLEACDGISIDYSVKSKDDERMKVAKKHKLSVLYPLFKDN